MLVWFPEKSMMQIESIGTLEIKDSRLSLLPSGTSVPLSKVYLGHYIMLAPLLSELIPYNELYGIRDYIDEFFKNNSLEIGSMSDFPTVYNDVNHGVSCRKLSCVVPANSTDYAMWYYLSYKGEK